ncbi:3'(2'),5'-bisphosphate nucleotidase 1 [Frankliniella occidentalis]|uniref:3'(2'),5'-bisphosphate nucleotidase 1 n=1 Tax=Frankliniella occidentalis TaxID=133901 RepID=A0A6J1SHN9_FRAOC|nr:3'(2'),5'-bisphosphate nucleotidase 1 [Frankliniella occidentalis]XP_026280724.1 3'(2'),5'-bisphosphate nucleotidase 1 [Frankliniella occidentalis]
MAQSSPLILRLVAFSINAANRAGKIIRDVWSQGELGIVDKGKNDLQTEADRSAQRCIIASLLRQFPNITIIGEEGSSNCEVPSDWLVTESDPSVLQLNCPKEFESVTDKEVVVWVDPLDGTSEYTQGLLEHVTVLVGIAVGSQAVGGIIHQPYYGYASGAESLGRTLWGIKGIGVGGFTPSIPPANQRIIATTRSHSNALAEQAIEALKADKVLCVGGAGHKVLLLMEGKAHAYVFARDGCKRWDTCAPEAVLEAMGGRLTDMRGNQYAYDHNTYHANKGGVLATAKGEDHDWYIRNIPENVRESLK